MREEHLSPQRRDAQVDGPDHRRARRHRAGAVGRVRADGVLRRLGRRDLPAVLDHDGVGDGAVGAHGARPHAGALRDPAEAGRARRAPCDAAGFFGWFNRAFAASSRGYANGVAFGLRPAAGRGCSSIYVGLIVSGSGRAARAAADVVPARRGRGHPLRPGADAARRVEGAHLGRARQGAQDVLPETRRATSSTACSRWSASTSRAPARTPGLVFVKLKDWSERKKASQSVQALATRATRYFSTVRDAMIIAFAPPAVMELGNATGFDMQLQNRGGLSHEAFLAARNQLLGEAAKNPALVAVRPNGVEDAPQVKIDIDREKASALGLSIADINQTLSSAWGSSYVNDFIDHGRVKRVYVQGEPNSRMQPADLNNWYVRNSSGGMVPFSAFATGEMDLRPAEAVALQRRAGLRDPRSARARSQLGRGHGHHGGPRGQAAGGHRPRMDGLVVRGEAIGLAGAAALRVVDRSSCSYVSPRSTRAGRSRSRCCSSCRSACSARCSPRSCGACRTTCTSRSACSRRSASRPRTRC